MMIAKLLFELTFLAALAAATDVEPTGRDLQNRKRGGRNRGRNGGHGNGNGNGNGNRNPNIFPFRGDCVANPRRASQYAHGNIEKWATDVWSTDCSEEQIGQIYDIYMDPDVIICNNDPASVGFMPPEFGLGDCTFGVQEMKDMFIADFVVSVCENSVLSFANYNVTEPYQLEDGETYIEWFGTEVYSFPGGVQPTFTNARRFVFRVDVDFGTGDECVAGMTRVQVDLIPPDTLPCPVADPYGHCDFA